MTDGSQTVIMQNHNATPGTDITGGVGFERSECRACHIYITNVIGSDIKPVTTSLFILY